MIWFTLALFVVSFIITALLAPKPDFEDARPQTLKDVAFPRATEDAPIPLVLGRVRMDAPNTIWYGDFKSVPIREKIKTGLFSSTRVTVGHLYYLGLDLALALGPGIGMTEIFMDDKSVWTGTTNATGPTNISISKGGLWGGYKEGGGWISQGNFYPGDFDPAVQTVDSYLEGIVGAGEVPAYTGTSHIVFNKAEIGESAQLRKMAFVLEKYTNDLGLSNLGKVGDDMNPAEAIYQIMTDDWGGMGLNPADIDAVTLSAIGETLLTEGNGVSVVVTAESTGQKLVQEILRQIDAIAFQDPSSGQITFKLIRFDYDVPSLPTYDEDDIINVRSFTRTAWDEVVAQVKVTFPQRDRESQAVAISQDMATVQMIGRLRSSTISMPFCYDKTLANVIASRERSQNSVPLFRMTLEMNRNANTLRPGDVFKLNWPEYGLVNLVMRVQQFDLGELLDGRIVIYALQDSFALATVIFAAPPDSGWVEPEVDPLAVAVNQVVEMPYFYANRLEFPMPDGSITYIPMAAPPGTNSTAFAWLHDSATPLPDTGGTREPDGALYGGTGTLSADYARDAGLATGYDATGFSITAAGFSSWDAPFTKAEIQSGEGGLLWVGGEWMGYENAVDNGGGNWDITGIYRGLLGTTPLAHLTNARVYQFNIDYLPLGTIDTLLENAPAETTKRMYYKFLDKAGRRTFEASAASELNVVAPEQGEAWSPLRPRFLQLEGQRAALQVTANSNQNLTWRATNRDHAQIPVEDDPAETPETAETYDVDVYIGGVLNPTLSATGVTSPYAVPFGSTSLSNLDCEFRVFSRRTAGDLRSSVYYAWLPFEVDQITFDLVDGGFSARRGTEAVAGTYVDDSFETATANSEEQHDILGDFNAVNGTWTPTNAGLYWVSVMGFPVTGQVSGVEWQIDLDADTVSVAGLGTGRSYDTGRSHGSSNLISGPIPATAGTDYQIQQINGRSQNTIFSAFPIGAPTSAFSAGRGPAGAAGDVITGYNTPYFNRGFDFDETTGEYTAPATDLYIFSAMGFPQGGLSGAEEELELQVNGVADLSSRMESGGNHGRTKAFVSLQKLTAADTVRLRQVGDVHESIRFHGVRLDNVTKSFSARKATSGGALDTKIDTFVEDWDDTGLFDASTGVFTADEPGRWFVMWNGMGVSGSTAETNIRLELNGVAPTNSADSWSSRQYANVGNHVQAHGGAVVLNLAALETVALWQSGALMEDVYFAAFKIEELTTAYLNPGSHRYWRVFVDENQSGGSTAAASVDEIELRATSGGADLTPTGSGVASADSILSGTYPASNAFNNLTGVTESWVSLNVNYGTHWIAYDLGAGNESEVHEISWAKRPDSFGANEAMTEGRVQFSDDGVTWYDAWAISTPATWVTGAETRVFTAPWG